MQTRVRERLDSNPTGAVGGQAAHGRAPGSKVSKLNSASKLKCHLLQDIFLAFLSPSSHSVPIPCGFYPKGGFSHSGITLSALHGGGGL